MAICFWFIVEVSGSSSILGLQYCTVVPWVVSRAHVTSQQTSTAIGFGAIASCNLHSFFVWTIMIQCTLYYDDSFKTQHRRTPLVRFSSVRFL
jgi:hypothetical protein